MKKIDREAQRDREAWLRRLGEASALPPDDEQRQEVEAEVSRRGGWAEAQWLALLEEGERLRLELARVDPPEGLESRLLAIPVQNRPPASLAAGVRRSRAWLAAAALLAIGIGVFFVLARADSGFRGPTSLDPAERAVREVALLALNDHLDTHTLEVVTDDRHELCRQLDSKLPFAVELPDLGRTGLTPLGGRRCTLGSHPVAFTSWQGSKGRVTVLQLRRSDFDLPADMAPRVFAPDGKAADAHRLDVFFVGREPFVWVFVADDGADLDRIRAELGS